MNLGNYRQAIQDTLTKTSSDTFHTTAILNRFINRAAEFTAKYKPWEQTQHVWKLTPTLAGDETDEYWDYPEDCITDSIYRLAVGTGTIASDVRYKPLTWEEYLDHKEDYNTSDKIWTDHRRQYFIYPIITGSPIVSVWGQQLPAAMTADTDDTPFTDDAVLEEATLAFAEALALIKMRGSYIAQGKERKAEAIAMLNQAWDQQRKRQAVKKTEHAEIWEHTDLMSRRAGDRITRRGSFNLDY